MPVSIDWSVRFKFDLLRVLGAGDDPALISRVSCDLCGVAWCSRRNLCGQILDLNRNSISDVGAQAMADGLKQAHALQLLILSTNRISDTGAYGLALAARNNPNLNHIVSRRPTCPRTGPL